MTNYALIADPDQERASTYAAVFRDEGQPTVIVRDGAFAAATLVERGAPDVLLTELSLPRVDGFELIERLRRAPSGDKTPVIVVSASRELRDTAADLRRSLGISAILAKAASDDSLRRVVKRIRTDPATPPAAEGAKDASGEKDKERDPTPQSPPAERDSGIRVRPTVKMPSVEAPRRKVERGRR